MSPAEKKETSATTGASAVDDKKEAVASDEQKIDEIDENELSDEDRELKIKLEGLLSNLSGGDNEQEEALKALRTEIRSATSSMTSVPKPLKFLRPHYSQIHDFYATATADNVKQLAADVISLVAMTVDNAKRDCLNFRLLGTSTEPLSSWGHEYVKHLQGEISIEYNARITRADDDGKDAELSDLIALAEEIVPYCIHNNAEPDACDLLMELERLDMLLPHVDETSCDRVCLYLQSCVPFVPEPYDEMLLMTCLDVFKKFSKWPLAMEIALRLNKMDIIIDVFKICDEKSVRRQLAILLGRQQFYFDVEEILEDIEDDDDELEKLRDLMANTHLSESFLALGKELDISEPKAPEDVYKTENERSAGQVANSQQNLSSTLTSAFVNAGFGTDKLILVESGNKWLFKHKGRARIAATASLGMLYLWDVEGGLTAIDQFLSSDKENIKAGALLAMGVVNSTVRDENEPALALLSDYVESKVGVFRVGSVMGLGLAYAGTQNESVTELLLPILEEADITLELRAVTALALGQIHVGSANGAVGEAIASSLFSIDHEEHNSPHARLIAVAAGLVFMGKQSEAQVLMDIFAVVHENAKQVFTTIVDSIAYAGTGNVLKIQEMLHKCSEYVDPKDKSANDLFQAYATVGIAVVAMGEEISVTMALRSMNHLLQYGEPVIRRTVPIAMALLCTSNPVLSVLDLLSKLTHDPDMIVAYNSILALGIIGAGTNHARIAGMLRTLAQYYSKSNDAMFVVRVAQGLLYTGKGSITLSPFHTERRLLSTAAASGLLTFLFSLVDVKTLFLKDYTYMVYNLALAMSPRILSLFDEDLNPLSLAVRVGQAVDVVGQAGKPKTITGFITNNTPVLLGFGERAQLAEGDYEPLTPTLEGFVICKKVEEESNKDGKASQQK